MAVAAKSLEACLIEQGAVSEAIIEKARERQRDGKRLGDVLQEMGAIDGKAWAQALASHFGLPFIEQLPDDGTAAECVSVLPINFAKRYQLLPVRKDGDTIVVATADPSAARPARRRARAAAQADPGRRRAGPGDRRRHQPHLRRWPPTPPPTSWRASTRSASS